MGLAVGACQVPTRVEQESELDSPNKPYRSKGHDKLVRSNGPNKSNRSSVLNNFKRLNIWKLIYTSHSLIHFFPILLFIFPSIGVIKVRID